MVYESKNEQRGVTAVVTQDGPDSYTVSMCQISTGDVLPYHAKGFRLDQAKARADRWAKHGSPMGRPVDLSQRLAESEAV